MPEHRLQNCKQRMPWKLCDFERATLKISSARNLEEEKTTRLQGWQEKSRGTEKLQCILISQVNG